MATKKKEETKATTKATKKEEVKVEETVEEIDKSKEELEKAEKEKKELEKQLKKAEEMLKKMESQMKKLEEVEKEDNKDIEKGNFNIEKPRKIERSEMIPVKSNVSNKLIYQNKSTGYKVVWQDKGDLEYIEFGELITMRNTQPGFLHRPLIIVEDVDASKRLGTDRLYRDIENLGDIKEMLELPKNKLKERLDSLPKQMFNVVRDYAIELAENGELQNAVVINNLNDLLRFDFDSALQLYVDSLSKE